VQQRKTAVCFAGATASWASNSGEGIGTFDARYTGATPKLPARPHGARCVAEVYTVARRHFDKRCRHADTFRLQHPFYQQFRDGISLALTRSSGNPLDLPEINSGSADQRSNFRWMGTTAP
jgi:hypothetical protein